MPVNYGVVYDVSGVSVNAEAAIVAAVPGTRHVVRKAALESTGAGVVVFKDGLAGTVIASVYLAATTRTTIGDETWGPQGKRLGAGNALTATLSGQTLNGQVICDDEV